MLYIIKKVFLLYGEDNLQTGFNKTGFNNYMVLMISNIIVLFSNIKSNPVYNFK